ncbi:MAG: hypothetical protein MJZ89_02040 [Paludibacteraceae bacterium]|nr:hypothetical protein [Paludibacteraceae bacterium]
MKKIVLFAFLLWTIVMQAGVTTYTFTSINWASKQGATTCDNVSDGWICDQAASEYQPGRNDAAGELMSKGVGVKTGTTGAGATSVRSFTNVRQIRLNFCLNSSKGKGVIFVQVGNNDVDSLVIRKPAVSGSGVYNRDSILTLDGSKSGNVKFWVKCIENGIYLNTLTIRAEEGAGTPFTTSSYRLVTAEEQLQDSDQIIIGVPSAGRIMGYFDETISQNNIHAIRGSFSSDGNTVAARDEAIYTLRKFMLGDTLPCYYIQDEIRYEEAYLVASGGRTKNRLSLWTHLYDSRTYGNYGYWTIAVGDNGDATICNLGNSLGRYLQYNAGNSPDLFGCYQQQGMQTPVKIYREVQALGDVQGIVAPMANFGMLQLNDGVVDKTMTIEVNANRLTEEIQASLTDVSSDSHGQPVFSLLQNRIDRDGDNLSICFHATEPGHYRATLTLTSGPIVETAVVMAQVAGLQHVVSAVAQPDYSTLYMGELEVTKKFDRYIFVRDATGSMLLYDTGDSSGQRYGQGLLSGDILTGVIGRFQNYFGLPELLPTQTFSSRHGSADALPEIMTQALDSADVCRFVKLPRVVIDDDNSIVWQGEQIPVVDAFGVGIIPQETLDLTAIVMWSWDHLELWIVNQTSPVATDLELHPDSSCEPRLVIENGHLFIVTHQGRFTLMGNALP